MKPLLLILLILSTATAFGQTIESGGRMRDYILHLPEGYTGKQAMPLVMVFHGGGGTARQAMKHSLWNPLADRHGFIVCYPNAAHKHWNDGRINKTFRKKSEQLDDVGFIIDLLDHLQREYRIDTHRVFATGASNGGMFSQRLAIEHADRFAAIAPLISSIPEELAAQFHPAHPVSVLMINGTDDPIIPYTGGDIRIAFFPRLAKFKKPKSRGKVISTAEAVQLWVEHNHLTGPPEIRHLPDTDPTDGTTSRRKIWTDAERNISVELIVVEGGGHTYPGTEEALSERIVGKTSHDFNATETIWEFFATHGRN